MTRERSLDYAKLVTPPSGAAAIRAPPVESRVFEVTKDDRKVVWEFRFPTDYGVYRADRITPPLVHAVTN